MHVCACGGQAPHVCMHAGWHDARTKGWWFRYITCVGSANKTPLLPPQQQPGHTKKRPFMLFVYVNREKEIWHKQKGRNILKRCYKFIWRLHKRIRGFSGLAVGIFRWFCWSSCAGVQCICWGSLICHFNFWQVQADNIACLCGVAHKCIYVRMCVCVYVRVCAAHCALSWTGSWPECQLFPTNELNGHKCSAGPRIHKWNNIGFEIAFLVSDRNRYICVERIVLVIFSTNCL